MFTKHAMTFLQDNMPNYKLTYFEYTGRAESIRWIFAVAGVDFVDEVLTWEEHAERKPGEISIYPTQVVDVALHCTQCVIKRYTTLIHISCFHLISDLSLYTLLGCRMQVLYTVV